MTSGERKWQVCYTTRNETAHADYNRDSSFNIKVFQFASLAPLDELQEQQKFSSPFPWVIAQQILLTHRPEDSSWLCFDVSADLLLYWLYGSQNIHLCSHFSPALLPLNQTGTQTSTEQENAFKPWRCSWEWYLKKSLFSLKKHT